MLSLCIVLLLNQTTDRVPRSNRLCLSFARVNVHAVDTVFIVNIAVDQVGDKSGATGTGGVMKVATYVTAVVPEPVRMRGSSGVQQNSGGAAG